MFYAFLITASLCPPPHIFCSLHHLAKAKTAVRMEGSPVAPSLVLLSPVLHAALSRDSPHHRCLFSCHHFTVDGGTSFAAAVIFSVASASSQCFVKVNLELSSPPPLLAFVTTLSQQQEAVPEIVFAFQ